MPIKDPVLRAEYHKKYMKDVWYPANRRKHQLMVRRRKVVISSYINKIKISRGCFRCPETEPCCLDFHHVLGEKFAGIATLANLCWSWKRIDEEIAKCILLCSNCHRKEHKKLRIIHGK